MGDSLGPRLRTFEKVIVSPLERRRGPSPLLDSQPVGVSGATLLSSSLGVHPSWLPSCHPGTLLFTTGCSGRSVGHPR